MPQTALEQEKQTAIVTKMPDAERRAILEQSEFLIAKIAKIEVKDADTAKDAQFLMKECTGLENLIEEKRTSITKPINDALKELNAMAKELAAPVTKAKDEIKAKQVAYAQKLEREAAEREAAVMAVISQIRQTADESELEVLAFEHEEHPDSRIKAEIETRRSYFEEEERKRKLKEAEDAEAARIASLAAKVTPEQLEEERRKADEKLKQMEADAELRRINEDAAKQEAKEKAAEDERKREKAAAAAAPKGIRKVLKFEVSEASLVPRALCSPDETEIRNFLKENPHIREIPGVRIWSEDKIQ